MSTNAPSTAADAATSKTSSRTLRSFEVKEGEQRSDHELLTIFETAGEDDCRYAGGKSGDGNESAETCGFEMHVLIADSRHEHRPKQGSTKSDTLFPQKVRIRTALLITRI